MGSKNTTRYQLTELKSITAIDLSEDRSILSTKNDEIMISFFNFVTSSDTLWTIENDFYLSNLIFDSLTQTHILHQSLENQTPENNWIICITEIDEDHSEKQTHQKLKLLLLTEKHHAFTSKSKVDDLIKDNDFLGYILLDSKSHVTHLQRTIKGNDLLDPYTYTLEVIYL